MLFSPILLKKIHGRFGHTNGKNVCLCVTLSVGTVFLYLNNNRLSPNLTRGLFSITPRDAFFIFLKFKFFLRFLTYIIILSTIFWSCQTYFLEISRPTDHKKKPKQYQTSFVLNFSTLSKNFRKWRKKLYLKLFCFCTFQDLLITMKP